MPERIKVGIIGAGQIGKNHVKQYVAMPDDVEIVAIADLNEAAAQAVAGLAGVKRVVRNFRELLAIEEIQAVDVCLHNNLHAPVSIAALEAGKQVYCEKPLAGSYADALSMIQASKQTGRRLYMQAATVFSKETKSAKRLLEEGRLGKIYYAKSSAYRRRGRPFVDGYGSPNFVQKEVAAGGALFDMGVYHIVEILYLLGNPEILSVSGATHQEVGMYEERRKSAQFNVEELGIGFVRLGGGISFFIEEAWAVNLGGTDGSKIAGATGGLCLSPLSYHATVGDMEMNATFDLEGADFRWHKCQPNYDGYDSPARHWIAVLQGRVPQIDTAGLGLAMMKIAEGIYHSNRLGRELTASEIERASVSTAIKGL